MPVICNSIPKSGTFLLAAISECLGYRDSKMRFVDHGTSYIDGSNKLKRFEENADLNRFMVAPEDSFTPSHLTHSRELAAFLSGERISNLFIYRHPGDVLYSYVRFVTYSSSFSEHSQDTMNTQQQFRNNFCSDEERFLHVFESLKGNFNFSQNANWLVEPSCLNIRFEDLFKDIQGLADGLLGPVISQIIEYLGVELSQSPEQMYRKVFGRGPTFSQLKSKVGQYEKLERAKIEYVLTHPIFETWLEAYGYGK